MLYKGGNFIRAYPDADNHSTDATRYALEKYYKRRGNKMCDMQNFKDMLYDNALLYPCLDCKKDKQEGNPYYWQTSCYDCKKERDWKIKMANISIELIKNSVMKGKLK